MSSSPLLQTPQRLPATPLLKRTFDLGRVQGLSTRALDTHLSLYETYVKQANSVLELLHDFPRAYDLASTERLQRDGLVRRLAFELNGVSLHELFFEALDAPRLRSSPRSGAFADAVDSSFGSFDMWKRDVAELAETRGVGWVVTLSAKGDNRLMNLWVDEHSHGLLPSLAPVAVFDLWEHAYLLDFKPSQKAAYLDALFDNIDWSVIESRCD